MPALTHGRVKNGFSGPIRKNNASTPAKTLRVQGSNNAEAIRTNAIVGGIGARNIANRAAIEKRVSKNCNCKK